MSKLKPGMKREIIDLWQNGRPAAFITKAYGLHRMTLNRWLNKWGVPRRTGGSVSSLTPDVMDVARKMREEGLTWDAVADRMGYTKAYLQLRMAGRSRRKVSEVAE